MSQKWKRQGEWIRGGQKYIYRLVNIINGKPRKPPYNLTTDQNGNLLQTPEAITMTWKLFLGRKFQPTSEESLRPEMESIPSTADPITRTELNSAVKKLNLGKATGPDGVPAVVFKACPKIKEELFNLPQFMWTEEVL